MTAGVSRPAPKVGRLAGWKLTEPVALYVGAAQVLAGVAVLVAGFVHGGGVAQFAVAAVVLFWMVTFAGGWAARASAYSLAGTLQAIRAAVEQLR